MVVPGTPFHVITHSSTDEKIDAIRQAWRTLGLPPGGLLVEPGRVSVALPPMSYFLSIDKEVQLVVVLALYVLDALGNRR